MIPDLKQSEINQRRGDARGSYPGVVAAGLGRSGPDRAHDREHKPRPGYGTDPAPAENARHRDRAPQHIGIVGTK